MRTTCNIFYAWQDDIENELNRYFIRDSLKKALKNINKKSTINEAPRYLLQLDHDTKNIPGIPEIANTIFKKISECDIFVADLTFIAESENGDKKKMIPNPNVILELGYAISNLGSSKIICVMNEAFGRPDKLFFDLVHRRWPITYSFVHNKDLDQKEIQEKLSDNLENAILEILKNFKDEKLSKGKTSKLFTPRLEEDFDYIYQKLNRDVEIGVRITDPNQTNIYHNVIESINLRFKCSLLEIIMLYQGSGRKKMSSWDINSFLTSYFQNENILSNYSDKKLDAFIIEVGYFILLRTVGITRITTYEDEFNSKAYKFRYWLEYNQLILGKLNLKEISE